MGCSVCQSELRSEIDQQLNAGASARAVSTQLAARGVMMSFGLLARHRYHISAAVQPAASPDSRQGAIDSWLPPRQSGAILIGLVRRTPSGVELTPAGELEAIDLGRLQTTDRYRPAPLFWPLNRIGQFHHVQALGYPFAIDEKHNTLVPRGFKGHIVAERPDFLHKDQAPVFELSFAAPSGLSGAPLLIGDTTGVSGVIIGNHDTEMGTKTCEEAEPDADGRRVVYERRDYLSLGVAVVSTAILDRGMGRRTVRQHLEAHGMPVELVRSMLM